MLKVSEWSRFSCSAQSEGVDCQTSDLTFHLADIRLPSALLLCDYIICVIGSTICCIKMCVMREMGTWYW